MNTFTQAISSERIQPFNFLIPVLILAVLLSAFILIYLKDLNRRWFIQYQHQQEMRQQYETDWGKLLLEQSTWSTQARIQTLAQKRLGMIYPKQKNIVIVEE